MFLFGKETGGSWYETGISGRWWKKEGPIGRWNRFAVPSDVGTGLCLLLVPADAYFWRRFRAFSAAMVPSETAVVIWR